MDRESLEHCCDACDGQGVVRDYAGEHRCTKCDGAGYVPTELGEQILALMRHNFKPMLQDSIGH